MIFPAPSSTPNESNMIGSGVRYFEKVKENTAIIYIVIAKIEEMLNQKNMFFSVWIITSLLAGDLCAAGSVKTHSTKLL